MVTLIWCCSRGSPCVTRTGLDGHSPAWVPNRSGPCSTSGHSETYPTTSGQRTARHSPVVDCGGRLHSVSALPLVDVVVFPRGTNLIAMDDLAAPRFDGERV